MPITEEKKREKADGQIESVWRASKDLAANAAELHILAEHFRLGDLDKRERVAADMEALTKNCTVLVGQIRRRVKQWRPKKAGGCLATCPEMCTNHQQMRVPF